MKSSIPHCGSHVEPLEQRALLSLSPVGAEFRANSYTTSAQYAADVAVDADGDFVVAWQSLNQDGSNYGVYAQRYNSAGVAQGAEFRVNTFTTGSQSAPAVAMDAAGDFVIAWTSVAQDGDSGGIVAQRYNAGGVAQGSEFVVNSYTTSSQGEPAISCDDAGDFVVTWFSFNQDGDGFGVFGRRFNAAGAAQGGEFQVNTFTTGNERLASVALDSDGDFVVTWASSAAQDGSNYGIYAQRFNSSGVKQGAEFRVNSYTTNYQNSPDVGIDAAGDFVIAWQSLLQDGNDYGVYAQRFNAAGTPQGSEFQVNSYTTLAQGFPSVAVNSAGEFTVAWTSNVQDGSARGAYAQQFSAAGVPLGAEVHASTATANSQGLANIAVDHTGDYVVVWNSFFQDGNDYGVYGQRFAAATTVPAVTTASFAYDTLPLKLNFVFNLDVASSNFSDANIASYITIANLTGGGTVSPNHVTYVPATKTLSFTFPSTLPDANFRATLNKNTILAAGTPMAANYVYDFFALAGDADHNRSVNISDLGILASNWQGTGKVFSQGDFNYDGKVDISDLGILASHWQQSIAAPGLTASRPTRNEPEHAITLIAGDADSEREL